MPHESQVPLSPEGRVELARQAWRSVMETSAGQVILAEILHWAGDDYLLDAPITSEGAHRAEGAREVGRHIKRAMLESSFDLALAVQREVMRGQARSIGLFPEERGSQ